MQVGPLTSLDKYRFCVRFRVPSIVKPFLSSLDWTVAILLDDVGLEMEEQLKIRCVHVSFY